MLLARKSQQVAGFSSLSERIFGKFKVDKHYEEHVDLNMELKYHTPLNKIFQRTTHIEQRLAQTAMMSPKHGIPEYVGARSVAVEAARLDNGVTTVAVDSAAPIVHLGVYLGVGTRNETRDNAGLLQVVKNAWLGTTTRRNIVAAHREPLQCGTNIEVTVGRDSVAITTSCTRDKASLILDHMTQNVICPEFFNHELFEAKRLALHQADLARANSDTLLLEEAYNLAYRGVGMGRSLYLNKHNAGAIDRDAILDFIAENFKDANNMAVVGVGLDSESLSGLADEYLWSLEGGSGSAPPSPWTGMRESRLEGPGNGTKILFLTKGAALGSPDSLTLGVMRHLIGAEPAVYHGSNHGALVAAAAPYAQHPFSVKCVNINDADSGMFGISVAGHSDEAGDILRASIGVVRKLGNPVSDEQLQSAKERLQMEIIVQREGPPANILSTNGLESIALGTPSTTAQLCSVIDDISASDIKEMAKKIQKEHPIFVSYGNQENLPLPRELI